MWRWPCQPTAVDASMSVTIRRCGTHGSYISDFHFRPSPGASNPRPYTLQRTTALAEIMRDVPTVTIAVPSHTAETHITAVDVPSLSKLHGTANLKISMHNSTAADFRAVLRALAGETSDALHDLVVRHPATSFTAGIEELATLALRAPFVGLRSASFRLLMVDENAKNRSATRPGPDVAATLGAGAVEVLARALPHFVWATKVEVEIVGEGERCV
ncbi:uncharacterized protein BXZ73DRAFT_75675 [Epithele typhae]|uniref:uncharacterized protein n=1 Tax=Epithele typhae TaxID=378194 RepID=UPI0020087E06|nr:uncharacterized protein BXZ73DRAFT_75675 [Epithele typhae]KAH9940053.1 hypothetical protein BXZ73DRAFT_75675 [Epithele typhae]